jgi:hypothetical protein
VVSAWPILSQIARESEPLSLSRARAERCPPPKGGVQSVATWTRRAGRVVLLQRSLGWAFASRPPGPAKEDRSRAEYGIPLRSGSLGGGTRVRAQWVRPPASSFAKHPRGRATPIGRCSRSRAATTDGTMPIRALAAYAVQRPGALPGLQRVAGQPLQWASHLWEEG